MKYVVATSLELMAVMLLIARLNEGPPDPDYRSKTEQTCYDNMSACKYISEACAMLKRSLPIASLERRKKQ